MEEERHQCSFCSQELAHSAYYRHLNDTVRSVCPGKASIQQSLESTCSDSSTDSTFDISSDNDEAYFAENSTFSQKNASSESEMEISFDDDTSSSGEEVWELSDSSDGDNVTDNEENYFVPNVFRGITFFLAFFHLFFHLSERAMKELIQFVRVLLYYLATSCNDLIISQVAKAFPKHSKKIKTWLPMY